MTEEKVYFGSKKVNTSEKQGLVNHVFTTVSKRYDFMNDISSLFLQRLWKEAMLDQLPSYLIHKAPILDLASGTGDIARRLARRGFERVTACDINPDMLAKAPSPTVCANAEALPFAHRSFEAITIAFGLRNVTNPSHTLREAWRILTFGGIFVCLEFSKVIWPLFDKMSHYYKYKVVPQLGEWCVGTREPYVYLAESIDQFPDQETLMGLMQTAGFEHVRYINLMGGLVAIHVGYKV